MRGQWGSTALHQAAAHNSAESVRQLLAAKASLDIKDTVSAFCSCPLNRALLSAMLCCGRTAGLRCTRPQRTTL